MSTIRFEPSAARLNQELGKQIAPTTWNVTAINSVTTNNIRAGLDWFHAQPNTSPRRTHRTAVTTGHCRGPKQHPPPQLMYFDSITVNGTSAPSAASTTGYPRSLPADTGSRARLTTTHGQ